MNQIPSAGGASPELTREVHELWAASALRAGIDLTGWDPSASLVERLAWAQCRGILIGGTLSRYSSKLQHSTSAQVQDCVCFAAAHNIYVPPEFVCVDEGISGRKVRRDGLERMRALLEQKLVRVLLVFKVSRLFRVAYKGFQFFQEDVVEEGLRAISISQGIDTVDEKSWKHLAYLHGIMDEMLLATIADHVRSGITSLFRNGYVTGALSVGYFAKEVPGAPLTNRGRPRTMPAVVESAADLLRRHYQLILDGLPIKEGWRRWVQSGGPHDPRSKMGFMTYPSYRRMLSNPRYTGRWAFGKRRNEWSNKLDYTRQVLQPDTEVVLVVSEELRIIDDPLFFAVQERLALLKGRPRGPKRRRELRLWDLVTDCFHCAACSTDERPVRFYQAGANGHGMRCKHADVCPQLTVVRREEAVRFICAELTALIGQDADLVTQVVACAQELDAGGDEQLREEQQRVEQTIANLNRKINDLLELAGEGSDTDRETLKGKVRAAQATRAAAQVRSSELQHALDHTAAIITPERVREILAGFTTLLEASAHGDLGEDAVHRGAQLFRELVGGRVDVHVESRPCRKHKNVQGRFTPRLLSVLQAGLQDCRALAPPQQAEVQVWLRKPPRKDALAARVHQLIDVEELSFRSAASVLQAEGHSINSGVVWQTYQRYYEMLGQPMPDRPYNNGHPRRPD